MIRFENIDLSYKGVKLIDDLCFEINSGEKACLVGRSGTGKTTLLKMIPGFEFPDKGNVFFDGMEITPDNLAEIRKQIAWLPQNYSVLGTGSVEKIIYNQFNFAANKHLTPTQATLIDLMKQLSLEEGQLKDDFVELSGGEKQRIALLICKLLDRKLVIFDEPSSALDKKSVELVAAMFLDDPELTVLSTSHDEAWLSKCNKIIEL
jgi:UDP-glucose/iron transport system ATP-binding protein